MRNFKTSTAALACSLLIAGCASMSEDECRHADWYDQGMRDGQQGSALSRVESHREACSKVGVAPDFARYQEGHRVGIRSYCTPDNGLRQGREGRSYQRSCPAELEPAFLDRYRAGRRVYDAEQQVNQLTSEISNKERELDRARDDDARNRVRRQIRELDDRLRRARNDVYDAERRARY